MDDETRSVRSEFDYSTKKKFVDIVKTNPMRHRGLKEGMLDGLNGNSNNANNKDNMS